MRARAFQVDDRVRWNHLYHEEDGLFLPARAPHPLQLPEQSLCKKVWDTHKQWVRHTFLHGEYPDLRKAAKIAPHDVKKEQAIRNG